MALPWDRLDKKILAKAVGIVLLGWLALPIVYYMLLKRKKGEVKEDDRKE